MTILTAHSSYHTSFADPSSSAENAVPADTTYLCRLALPSLARVGRLAAGPLGGITRPELAGRRSRVGIQGAAHA